MHNNKPKKTPRMFENMTKISLTLVFVELIAIQRLFHWNRIAIATPMQWRHCIIQT